MKLGARVSKIRHQEHYVKDHPERRAELDALGFVWDDLERRWEEEHVALLAYHEMHGDLQMPRAFVVPSEAPWPEETWGMMLGRRVDQIRHREEALGMKLGKRVDDIRSKEIYVKHHPERRAELDVLGFRWT
jgi:hypothetical protein